MDPQACPGFEQRLGVAETSFVATPPPFLNTTTPLSLQAPAESLPPPLIPVGSSLRGAGKRGGAQRCSDLPGPCKAGLRPQHFPAQTPASRPLGEGGVRRLHGEIQGHEEGEEFKAGSATLSDAPSLPRPHRPRTPRDVSVCRSLHPCFFSFFLSFFFSAHAHLSSDLSRNSEGSGPRAGRGQGAGAGAPPRAPLAPRGSRARVGRGGLHTRSAGSSDPRLRRAPRARPAPPAPTPPRRAPAAAGARRAGSAPRKRGGPGWAGRGGAGRAALAPAAAPEQSRGRRDPRPSAATGSATRAAHGAPRPASGAAQAAGRRPPTAPEPQRRAARADPGRGERGSPHPSRDSGGAGRARGLAGRRPAEPAAGGKVRPGVAGGVGGRGALCLGTEGFRFVKVQGPSRQGLGRPSGAFWGSARVGLVRGAGLAHPAPLRPLSGPIDTPIILAAAIAAVCRDPPRAARRGVLL